jgi:hypothetical protein
MIILHPEVTCLWCLADGMAELAVNHHQRYFTLGQNMLEWL